MTHYGGLGGLTHLRKINAEDPFEATIARVFGERMKTDDAICQQIWSALANVEWYHPGNNDSAGYSFRAAGDLVAAVRGSGNYMEWYCSGPDGSITDEIRRAMKKEGWIADDLDLICDEPGCLRTAGCGWYDGARSRCTCLEHTGVHVASAGPRAAPTPASGRTISIRLSAESNERLKCLINGTDAHGPDEVFASALRFMYEATLARKTDVQG